LDTIHELLKTMVDMGASDLHLTVGVPPVVRVRDHLDPLDYPPLKPQDTRQLCYSILAESQKKMLEESQELDLSFGVRGLSRFRANIFFQRGSIAAAFRMIPYKIKSMESLGLPPIVEELCKRPKGLILVTGPTGSGKSTTLAAMIDKINTERRGHIVTIEDPIEFIHPHKSCIVNQREVHQDTKSFPAALRSILRQDPDVVLIGEMRDLETITGAITVSETGHLTLGTLHTNSSVEALNRIIDVFPANQQSQIRTQLSFVLEGVLCQTLVPTADGKGRALALEIMAPNVAIRNLIRENKIEQIYSQIQVGQAKSGMQTMNQSLFMLYKRNIISVQEALGRSPRPDEIRQMISSPSHGKLS
jgi:twitching motility protein PilT